MLKVAGEKGIYDKLYSDYITAEELPIPSGKM